ncbi:cytochrome b-c1 complex subunit 7-like [Argopecten irradians]|uniref:cytochrome b-c1 complex subunit 7-like n=1 Tax=Argopecten irradians TaxID=31199 RepID=UPI00372250CF
MFNKKVYRKLIYYPQMGLYRDDCTKRNIYAPGVLEAAVQRLPESVQRERQFRISRAFLHSTGKTILDRKEWTMDDDVEYLDSALASVIRDIEIKRYWDQNGEQPPDDFKLTPEQYQTTLSNMISQMQPAIQPK